VTDCPPTREVSSRVALVTCADLADLDPDDQLLVAALRRRGVDAVSAVWDDPRVDWSAFDLVVLRSPWDYPERRDEFVAWARRVPRLANPARVVARNTDKRYLDDLASAGVPVVPTVWLAPGDRWAVPAAGEWVIKPVVGAGSRDCGRYRLDDGEHRRLAVAQVARLHRQGRWAMVQPYLPAVQTYGETGLVFLADRASGGLTHSHAIRKGPMLAGPDYGTEGLYRAERITARTPTPAELAVAEAALAAVPGGADGLLYARVDVIPGADGAPLLVELELTEPSLFFGWAPGAADRFAAAVWAESACP
jgi:glutathione synthase/RimK-type ligase-like ATP-grasp enzyme